MSDGAIPGASLFLVREDTGESRSVLSGPHGEFIIALLPSASYRLEAEHSGYKKQVTRFLLSVNQELQLTIRLEIGSLQESVEVIAPFNALRKDSVALGGVVENKQVVNLPLDGRNFLELSLLLPGVLPAAPGSASSVRGDFSFNINGSREGASSFLLDGVANVDPKLNTAGNTPPVDAILEFELLTSTYDASFGRNGGGQVNVILKSGTNQMHGTAYEFLRNASLDARNFFAPANEPDPKYQRNQFGFSLGGPIRKGRSFFFADYEGTRLREGVTRVTNVPTVNERDGDFSRSLLPRPIDPYTQQPFPGGIVPIERQNQIGRAIAALYPVPDRSVPFQNFVSSPTSTDRIDQFDLRTDHQAGRNSSLSFRYSFSDGFLYEPFSGQGFAAIPGFGTKIPKSGQNLALSETHTFSANVLNEVRFGYGRVAAGSFHENQGTSLNQAVGLPEYSNNPRDYGLSFITLTGYSPLGDEYNNPQHSVTNSFQLVDNLTWARRNHLLKFGGDAHLIQQNAYRDIQSRGLLTFSSLAPVTGNALADLLLGYPVLTGGARLDNAQHLRTKGYSLFIHDNFQLRPNLTISAGIRYEYNTPPFDAFDRASLYDPTTQSIVVLGTSDMPRSGRYPDKNDWAPRVGITWSPRNSSSTVIRAGYGVYHDQSALAPGEGIYFNPPYYHFDFFFPLPGLPLTLNDPFPDSFPFPLPPSAQAIQRDLRTPYVQQWNLNVQQQIGRRRVLELAYAASRGTKLIAGRDINQPLPSPNPINPRPVFQFADINELESRSNSNYHSLQLRFQQSYDFGLSLLGAYTWSHSIDDASSFFSSTGDSNYPQNSYDLKAERGRSNFDLRHRFTMSFSYDLPIGKGQALFSSEGWTNQLFSGWQTHGILTLQSGRPFTVAVLPEVDISNTGRSSLGFGANDRPNVVGDPNLDMQTPERWFNTSAFAFPAFGSFGNSGRNVMEGPGFENLNLSLLKNTRLREGMTLQFRTEFFNLLNHPNLDLPDIFLGSPTFGSILSAQSPRHIQFGLKLLF